MPSSIIARSARMDKPLGCVAGVSIRLKSRVPALMVIDRSSVSIQPFSRKVTCYGNAITLGHNEFTMIMNLVNKPSLMPLSDLKVPVLQFVMILTI
jgi:hypothetical protein